MNTPREIYAAACYAGHIAATTVSVTQMIVSDHQRGNEYVVDDGMCGFAGVRITPARGKLVTYLKKAGIGYKSYQGGYYVGVNDYGQSITRKEAYARAFAKVLSEHNITCYIESRLD